MKTEFLPFVILISIASAIFSGCMETINNSKTGDNDVLLPIDGDGPVDGIVITSHS